MRHAAALILMIATTPAVAQTSDWEAKFYNPQPAANDLILPMPCGGKLVFRPVVVRTDPAGPLDDRTVPMGDPLSEGSDARRGDSEFIHDEPLAAPFPFAGDQRGYWIGKYVVTGDQFSAMGGHCGPPAIPTLAGRRPKIDVAPIEVMQATADWTSWLLAHARDKLPKRGAEFAFVRLPTEPEWEFAARGGSAVDSTQFSGRTWPMPDGIEHYVAVGDRAQPIGAEERPNPLGLYNVLGSVSQMMLEPFRLNRVGRLHGDAGGVILRGGNFKDRIEELHTGMRSEMSPYDVDTGQPLRLPTAGFRVVLAAVTSGDDREAAAQRQAFEKLRTDGTERGLSTDPRALIQAMKKDTTNLERVRQLDQLDAKLASNDRERADKDRETLRAEIEAASVMANFVWRLERNVVFAEGMTNYANSVAEKWAAQTGDTRSKDSAAAFEANMQTTIMMTRREQDASLDGYLAFLKQIVTDHGTQDPQASATLVRQEMTERGQSQLQSFLAVVLKHIAQQRGGALIPRDQARNDILAAGKR